MATGNVARNDITGQFIKSKPPTAAWTSNYDKAFAKKTVDEWLKGEPDIDSVIWDNEDNLDAKISYKDFLMRIGNSTIQKSN